MHILVLDDDYKAWEVTNKCFQSIISHVNILLTDSESSLFTTLDNLHAKGGCQPDLILTELHIPGLDPYKLVDRLNRYHLSSNIPVAFFTRSTNPKNYLYASRLNTPLFVKGLSMSEQTRAIENILCWYNSRKGAGLPNYML